MEGSYKCLNIHSQCKHMRVSTFWDACDQQSIIRTGKRGGGGGGGVNRRDIYLYTDLGYAFLFLEY